MSTCSSRVSGDISQFSYPI